MFAVRASPEFSRSQASEIAKRLYGLSLSEMGPLPSYDGQNFYVATEDGGEYVLKIFNFEDSKNTKLFDVQMQAVSFLQQNGMPVPTAVPTVSGQITSLEEADFGCGCQKYLVILLTYLPGIVVSKVPLSAQLLYEAGKTAARMDIILQEVFAGVAGSVVSPQNDFPKNVQSSLRFLLQAGHASFKFCIIKEKLDDNLFLLRNEFAVFQHPNFGQLQRDDFIWSLSNIPMLEGYLQALDGEPLKEVAEGVIHQYRTSVIPKRQCFRSSLIHGDFNDQNVLVQPDENGGHRISGILDFNHLNLGCYVYELAICIMYMMLEHPRPIEVGGLILAGWESVLPLNEAEKGCLYTLVMSRFCQSCVLARHMVILHPENADYLMITSKTGVSILRQLWELGKEEVENVWFQGAAQYSRQNMTRCDK